MYVTGTNGVRLGTNRVRCRNNLGTLQKQVQNLNMGTNCVSDESKLGM